MTIFTGPVFNWRTSGLDWDSDPYESASPNLLEIETELRARFGGGNMGIHLDRDTTNGKVSEHSWGAALDWGTGEAQVRWLRSKKIPSGPALTRAEHTAAVDWVVAHSAECHVQSIVDIGRSWMAERPGDQPSGWIPYDSGYTGHCHIVTTFDGFADSTPIADRLAPPIDPQPEEPDMTVTTEVFKFVEGTGPAYERVGNLARYLSADAWSALGNPDPVRRDRESVAGLHLLNECPREDRGIWANA